MQILIQNQANTLVKNIEYGQQLHYEFIKLGSVRFKLKNKMLLILPEIYSSGIWKKYAGSIVEYAGKYGDIAQTTVHKRLRLEENLIDKPYLRAAIATAGVHKVALVAKVATPETDKVFAEKISDMSKQATQALSKEVRAQQHEERSVTGDKTSEAAPECKAVPIIKKLELDEEATFLFLKLKAKLGKHMSDKEFVKMILQEKVKEEFPEKTVNDSKKDAVVTGEKNNPRGHSQLLITDERIGGAQKESVKPVTRYIVATKKRETVSQTSGRCGYPGCNRPHQVIHHPERFSECKNHDLLVPLCKVHHEFAHNNLIQNETDTTKNWKISILKTVVKTAKAQPAATQPTSAQLADILYRKYRSKVIT